MWIFFGCCFVIGMFNISPRSSNKRLNLFLFGESLWQFPSARDAPCPLSNAHRIVFALRASFSVQEQASVQRLNFLMISDSTAYFSHTRPFQQQMLVFGGSVSLCVDGRAGR